MLVSLWGFYVRRPFSGIADKYFFFLLGLCQLFISHVGVGVDGLSPISVSEGQSGKRSMSAGSSGSNDIDPSLNSIKVANFILLYGLRTVVQLFHSLLVSSVSVFFLCWLHTTSICASCLCRSLPFFCQYCWNVDGLGVAVELLCLRRFICRGVQVVCLCLNTSYVVTNGFPFRLPLVHMLGVSSPGGR